MMIFVAQCLRANAGSPTGAHRSSFYLKASVTERISSQFEQRRFNRHAGNGRGSAQRRSLSRSMRCRARSARPAERPNAAFSNQGSPRRPRDRRGFSLRPSPRHHHIPRALGQHHVRRFQFTAHPTDCGRDARRGADRAVCRRAAVSQLPVAQSPRRFQPARLLFASRCPADGRHDRLRCGGMVSGLSVLQSPTGAEETNC
jgi:hypothetical protein